MTSMNGRNVAATVGPYETDEQVRAAAAVRETYALSRSSSERGVMACRNSDQLLAACDAADVVLGAYDRRILTWLAGYEPEMVEAVAGIIGRAYAAGRTARQ